MEEKFYYSNETNEKSIFRSVFKSDYRILFCLALAGFALPIIFGHAKDFPNQVFVGSLVNAILALSALRFTTKKSLPVILLPSIGALVSGIIFGSFTIYLAFLAPFIWLGNGVYVYSIRKLKVLGKNNYLASVFASSLIKAGAIFIPTLALVSLGIVPEVFLAPMGLLQFGTAILGGILAGTTLILK